ncbi:MAG TPA: DUF4190 domain-containing protein [Pseudonocardiaceae bacterium]|nr:DUF4190 domain-containing protein [Pseudonocardiaceae bacterium]
MTQPYQPDDSQQDPYQSGPQYGPQYQVPYQPYYPPYGPPPPDHPQATTALVLGIVGIVVCQVLGPVAFYLGRKAMREIDASGGTLGGRGNAQAGFILGIVGMVMLALGLLFGVAYVVIVVFAIASSAT